MNDADLMSFTDALVNPKNSNSFGSLYSVYRTANDLVKRYGDVRIWNAESCHRPAGHESDPRSAVYVKTGKENALCTFSKLSRLVNATMNEQGHAMDQLGIPQFTADMLPQVRDFHHSTPGSGLMSLNAHFWGNSREAIEAAQLAVVRKFTRRGVKATTGNAQRRSLKINLGIARGPKALITCTAIVSDTEFSSLRCFSITPSYIISPHSPEDKKIDHEFENQDQGTLKHRRSKMLYDECILSKVTLHGQAMIEFA